METDGGVLPEAPEASLQSWRESIQHTSRPRRKHIYADPTTHPRQWVRDAPQNCAMNRYRINCIVVSASVPPHQWLGRSASRNCVDRCTHHAHYSRQDRDLRVLPPLLSPDAPCAPPEGICLARKSIGLVHEEVEALAALQDRVDVLDHDVLAAIRQVISSRTRPVTSPA